VVRKRGIESGFEVNECAAAKVMGGMLTFDLLNKINPRRKYSQASRGYRLMKGSRGDGDGTASGHQRNLYNEPSDSNSEEGCRKFEVDQRC